MSATEQQIIRRSTRLLAAVHELHKQGYQNLVVYSGMSSWGFHWRLQLFYFYDLTISNGHLEIPTEPLDYETNYHSSGQSGNLYFGWEDTTTVSARALAKKIKERFPRLINQCKAENFEYAGWFNYMLGEAENGILPVMYRDYYSAEKGFIASTKECELVAPPHCQLHETNGRKFVYANPHHVTNNDDWHTAYIPIINGFRSANIAKFPLYPIAKGSIQDLGSYWEGAIYYIQHILGIRRIDDFLNQLERYSSKSERWSSFFLIWDNFQQLDYLKGFLIRKMLMQSKKYPLDDNARKHWQVWLDKFEQENKEVNGKEPSFYNPYFGGSNPLHLGFILQEDDGDNQDNLFEL
jgi:hypothetical protein